MKALSKKAERSRTENDARIGYDAIMHAAPEIMQQTVALMLFAMSRRGYGKKRLHYFYGWFLSLLHMPEDSLGKVPQTKDVMKLLTEKYEIDFSKVQPRFKQFKEWYRDDN